jgi:hypothetical protein
MKKLTALLCLPALTACSGGASDPTKWTCEALIQPVIRMSEERSPTVLEITSPEERGRTYGPHPKIECHGYAEWSQGSGSIDYGAYVSDGGNVVLQYSQR